MCTAFYVVLILAVTYLSGEVLMIMYYALRSFSEAVCYINLFLAKAYPEPCFKYFSKDNALFLS